MEKISRTDRNTRSEPSPGISTVALGRTGKYRSRGARNWSWPMARSPSGLESIASSRLWNSCLWA